MTTEKRRNGGLLARRSRRRGHRDTPDTDRGFETGAVTGTGFVPGIVAGVAGLAVFLTLHAIWILPIWFVAPVGLALAIIGGAAVGWAYTNVEPALPAGLLRRWLAVTGGVVIILAPSVVVAWAGDPYFTFVDGVSEPTASVSALVGRFILEFLVVTILTGALIGWTVTRTRRGTIALAAAALALALGPGHNLPFFHIWTAPVETRTGLLLTLVPIVIASAVFVVIDLFPSWQEHPV